jgi:L-threonylcarbamoyladenylate synthase
MKILKDCYLSEIITELFAGKTIIYPTETSYGLGCDAASQEAVDTIFKIKGRSEDKPLLIIVPTVEMAKKYLVWNNTIERLANMYWPGPLTVVGVATANSGLATGVISKLGTVAVRVTGSETAKFLSESLGRPLVATSGNISQGGDMYDPTEVQKMFANQDNQPDIILDGGILPKRLPTTLVDASQDNIKILRQGELEIQDV